MALSFGYSLRMSRTLFHLLILFVCVSCLHTPATSGPGRRPVAIEPHPGASGGSIHVVEPGETLFAIARKYGSSVEEIRRRNPTVEPKQLRVGARLNLPPRKPVIRAVRGNSDEKRR